MEKWTTFGENWAGDGPFLPNGMPTTRMRTSIALTRTFASVKCEKLKIVMNKLKLKAFPCCIEQTGDSSENWIH